MRKNWVLTFCLLLVVGVSVARGFGPGETLYLPVTMKGATPTPTATTMPSSTPTSMPSSTPTSIPSSTPTSIASSTPTSIPMGSAEITHIEYNPAGSDADGEYVDIQNTGGTTLDMTGWKLYDNVNTTYTFPSFTLGTGSTVRVWVRSGTNDAGNLYWGRNSAVWNNDGDCGNLTRPDGSLVDQHCY